VDVAIFSCQLEEEIASNKKKLGEENKGGFYFHF